MADPIASTTSPGRPERLSAVVPCYREAESIPVMYRRLTDVFAEMGVDYEIIFVDSGSPDHTPLVLRELAERDRRVTVVRHTRAFGSQSAYSSGMRLATGDAVILLDGDLQDPPELIPQFYARWREGDEVVYGERVARRAPMFMRWAYKRFYRIFRRLSYLELPLDAGDFSLLDRRVVDSINMLPETDRFLRGLRAYVGFKQRGVPYDRPDRQFGRSSNNLLRNLGWARRAIISFSYVPLDLIGWLALFTTTLAVLMAIVEIVIKIVDPTASPPGYSTLIVVILLVGGIQLLCLTVVGSYMAHMYQEVKARPPYLVDQILNPPLPREPSWPAPAPDQFASIAHVQSLAEDR